MTQAETTRWNDFAMRANTSVPEGQVPNSGDICYCPDVIPNGSDPVQNPQSHFSTPASWSDGYRSAVVQEGAPNYIYVRAKNFYDGDSTGRVQLFYSGCEIINWPQGWLDNRVPVQNQADQWTVELNAAGKGEICVGREPFVWQPGPPPPGSTHWCLFALLDTDRTPNPLLHGGIPLDYSDMATLVAHRLDIGWRNVTEVSSDVPTWCHTVGLSIPDHDSLNQQLGVYVSVTDGLVGSAVAVSSGESQGFSPVIDIPRETIDYKGKIIGQTTVPEPGIAKTALNISFWKQTSNPGLQDRISTWAAWVPPSQEHIQSFVQSGVARRLPPELAARTGGWVVPLGAMHYYFSAKKHQAGGTSGSGSSRHR